MARIAKWHAEALDPKGKRSIIPDLAGAAVCEPILAPLSDADCEKVVRAFVADPDAYLAKHGHPLRLLDAARANRYLMPPAPVSDHHANGDYISTYRGCEPTPIDADMPAELKDHG